MSAVNFLFNPIIINQSSSKEHDFILVKPDSNASLSGEGFGNLHERQGRNGYGKAWQALEEEKMIWITMAMKTTMTTTTTWHFEVGKDLWNIFVCQVNTGDRNTANTDRQTYASVRMSASVTQTYMVDIFRYGPNPDNPSHRLMGENCHRSQKRPNLTIKMAIIQKSLLDKSLPWEYCPKNTRQIWFNFYSFWEIILFVQGLGQKIITVDQMSPVE